MPLLESRRNQVSPYEQFRATRHFGSLDGLRCLSIIGVLWHHAGGMHYRGHPTLNFLGMGYMGVDLFFVISGFLITTLLLRERDERGQISLKAFYIRRSLRIFPLYYTVLLVYVLLVWLLEPHTSAGRAFFHNLRYFSTYTSNMFAQADDTGHRVIFAFAWSLAAEEQFYILWPAVVRYFRRPWPWAMLGGLILVDQAFTLGLLASLLPVSPQGLRVVTAIATPIGYGVCMAMFFHWAPGYRLARRIVGYRWCSVAAIALVLLAMIPPVAATNRFRDVFALPMAFLVAACVVREDHGLATLLRWTPLRRIGIVSYGMYLTHMFAVHAVEKVQNAVHAPGTAVRFALAFALTYLFARISYQWYEGFFLRLKRRWERIGSSSGRAGAEIQGRHEEGAVEVAASPTA